MITVREFFELHSILTAIVEKELGLPALVPEAAKEVLGQKDGSAERPVPDPLLQWVALLNLAVNPDLLRRHMKDQGVVEEATIRALLRFLVSRKPHSQSDRDKVDWLVTYLFQAREERTKKPTGWPKAEVQAILQGFQFPPLSEEAGASLTEVSSMLDEIKEFEKFSQVTEARVIQRGRDLKKGLGAEFFHPDVLTPIVNYNLVFGKKFHSLLQQTMQKIHEFTSHQEESASPDTRELLRTDYRSTDDAFRRLSELGQKREPAKTTVSVAPAPAAPPRRLAVAVSEYSGDPAMLEDQLRNLGINVTQEVLNLRMRKEEIATRLNANPALNSFSGAWAAVPLMDWESSAFRANYRGSEQSFRVDFARAICHAIAILSRIAEELPAYEDKKGTEYLWKKHYDALLYLLQEGRRHKERLMQLSAASQQKGLMDKAKQLLQTAEKLEGGLTRVTPIF